MEPSQPYRAPSLPGQDSTVIWGPFPVRRGMMVLGSLCLALALFSLMDLLSSAPWTGTPIVSSTSLLAAALLLIFGLRRGGVVVLQLATDRMHLIMVRRLWRITSSSRRLPLPGRLSDVEVDWTRRHTLTGAMDDRSHMMEPALIFGRLVLVDEQGRRTPLTKKYYHGWTAHLQAQEALIKLLGCPARSEEAQQRQRWNAKMVREAADEAHGVWGRVGPIIGGVIGGAVVGALLTVVAQAFTSVCVLYTDGSHEIISPLWPVWAVPLVSMAVGAAVGVWVARTPRI